MAMNRFLGRRDQINHENQQSGFYAMAFRVHFQHIPQKPEPAPSAILEMHC